MAICTERFSCPLPRGVAVSPNVDRQFSLLFSGKDISIEQVAHLGFRYASDVGLRFAHMITQSQISEQLNRFLDGVMGLDDFEDWIALHSWNMHSDSSEEAQRLAWAIELNLSEYSSGHLDADGLRSELENLVPMNPGVEIKRLMSESPDVSVEIGTSMFIENFPTQSMDYVDMILVGASA